MKINHYSLFVDYGGEHVYEEIISPSIKKAEQYARDKYKPGSKIEIRLGHKFNRKEYCYSTLVKTFTIK